MHKDRVDVLNSIRVSCQTSAINPCGRSWEPEILRELALGSSPVRPPARIVTERTDDGSIFWLHSLPQHLPTWLWTVK